MLAKLWCILLTKPGKRNAILRLLDFVKAFSARALQRLKLSCHALCVGHEGSALLDGLHCFWTFEANSTLVNIGAYNSWHCCYLYKSTTVRRPHDSALAGCSKANQRPLDSWRLQICSVKSERQSAIANFCFCVASCRFFKFHMVVSCEYIVHGGLTMINFGL